MEGGMMPLDYLLGIMRDDDQDARWRLDAAKAAAPYCHARLSATEVSGPSGGPVSMQTTNKLDISGMTDDELDVLERALRKTMASQKRAEETTWGDVFSSCAQMTGPGGRGAR